jgi:hypothetical protein
MDSIGNLPPSREDNGGRLHLPIREGTVLGSYAYPVEKTVEGGCTYSLEKGQWWEAVSTHYRRQCNGGRLHLPSREDSGGRLYLPFRQGTVLGSCAYPVEKTLEGGCTYALEKGQWWEAVPTQ